MKTQAHPARTTWLVIAGLLAAMALLAGCGSSNSSSGGEELTEVGKGEGQLNLISWAGYVEPEWVKPFGVVVASSSWIFSGRIVKREPSRSSRLETPTKPATNSVEGCS